MVLGLGLSGAVVAPLCRYIEKESNAKNEHLRRLEQTTLEDLRKELVLVRRGVHYQCFLNNAPGDFWKEIFPAGQMWAQGHRVVQRRITYGFCVEGLASMAVN